MKLDATDLRYLSADEFRILTAAEMGSKNHEVVPASLIAQISGIRSGGCNKLMGQLAKRNLIARVQNVKYDGYRLTYGGYDYLAMKAMAKRDTVYSVGNQIGVGKESDIYVVADKEGTNLCMKMHRLGRISFRAIKEKRDYMGKRKSASWMYMSRLAAQKEWAFMKVLYANGFPVPTPIDQSRHCILMSLIDAYPMRQLAEVPDAGKLYAQLMSLLVRFARAGLIHGDFNEFNILIRREDGEPIVIDFPQMVSTSHPDAEWFFNRDVACIRTFFRRRFRYESKLYPRFTSSLTDTSVEGFRLDVEVEASGFGKAEAKALESYMSSLQDQEGGEDDDTDSEEEEEYSEEEDEEEEEGGETREEEVERLAREAAEEKETQNATSSTPQSIASTDPIDPTDPSVSTLSSTLASTSLEAPSSSSRPSSPTRQRPSPSSPTSSAHSSPSTPLPPLPSFSQAPPSPTHTNTSNFTSATSRTSAARRALPPKGSADLRETVTSEMTRERARQESRHHSRTGLSKPGRGKGSKKKTDTSARLMKAEKKGGAGDGW